MKRILAAAIASMLLLASLGAEAAPSTDSASATPIVYVSEGGSVYHRADCPRLHFGSALTLADAAKRYAPCPVCAPPRLDDGAAAAPSTPAGIRSPVQSAAETGAEPAAKPVPAPPFEKARQALPAASPGEPPEQRPARRHRLGPILGLAAGVVGGIVLGAVLGGHVDGTPEDPVNLEAGLYGAVIGGAVGGLGGFALGGGFSHNTDAALERGREAVRAAWLRQAEEAAAARR